MRGKNVEVKHTLGSHVLIFCLKTVSTHVRKHSSKTSLSLPENISTNSIPSVVKFEVFPLLFDVQCHFQHYFSYITSTRATDMAILCPLRC